MSTNENTALNFTSSLRRLWLRLLCKTGPTGVSLSSQTHESDHNHSLQLPKISIFPRWSCVVHGDLECNIAWQKLNLSWLQINLWCAKCIYTSVISDSSFQIAPLLMLFQLAQAHRWREHGNHQITLSGIIRSIHDSPFNNKSSHYSLPPPQFSFVKSVTVSRFKWDLIVPPSGRHTGVRLCIDVVRHAITTQDGSPPHSLALLIAAR